MDIKKYAPWIIGLSILALIFFTLVLGLGGTLGFDPAFIEAVAGAGATIWAAVTWLARSYFLKDQNANGVADILEDK